MFEIGFMCVGKTSIYLVAIVNCLTSFGCLSLYFIVYSGIAANLTANYTGVAYAEVWYTDRTVYVLGLGALLIPVVLKKELAELEWLSFVLFISIGIFISATFIELVFEADGPRAPITNEFW